MKKIMLFLLFTILLIGCTDNNTATNDTDANININNNIVSSENTGNDEMIEPESEPEEGNKDLALILIGNEFGNTYFEMKTALEAENFKVITAGIGGRKLMSSCPNHENVEVAPDMSITDITEENIKDYAVVFIPSGKHHRTIQYDRDVKKVLNLSKDNNVYISSVCAGNIVLAETKGLIEGYKIASSSVTSSAIDAADGIKEYKDVVCDGVFITGDVGGGQSGGSYLGAPTAELAKQIRASVDLGEAAFEDKNTVIDYDGNVYKVMTIGTQTWMVENLRVKHDKQGDEVMYYQSSEMVETDGYLYSSKVINDNLAPEGWRMPTVSDYEALFSTIATESNDVYSLSDNAFNMIKAGMYDFTGKYQWYSSRGVLGTKTQTPNGFAYFYFDDDKVEQGNFHPDDGVSIRCIKVTDD